MKTAVVFMADGMEMCECLLTVDILRRAKINVITASVMDRKQVTASHQVMICADEMAQDVDFSKADVVILPGGRVGAKNLAKNAIVAKQCRAFAESDDKYVAAICAAPYVLAGLGILDGKKATCHPDFVERVLPGSSFYDRTPDGDADSGDSQTFIAIESNVVPDNSPLVNLTHENLTIDGNIITGQGLGATMDFALCIAELLTGRETAENISKAICYKHFK